MCAAVALSFNCVIETCSDPPALLSSVLCLSSPSKWRECLVGSDTLNKSEAAWCATEALYVSRWCVAEDADEKRLQWQEKCRAVACRVLEALCDLLQRHDAKLLRHSHGQEKTSHAALLTSSVNDVALRFVENSNVNELLLHRIAGSSDLVYFTASHALVALCSSSRLNAS